MKLVLAVGLFCFCGTAQTLREKSWSASRAGASHDPRQLQSLVADLRDAFPLVSAMRDSEAYAYVESLLDAIIQIPGRVPIEALLPFQKSWLPEILVVLSRDPGDQANERALLDLRAQSLPDAEWSAVNDLLYAIGSPSFFQQTLSEIRISHEFYVAEGGMGFCGGSAVCTNGYRRKAPKGFPALTLYQLSAASGLPHGNQPLLFDKPVPIYYRTTVIPADRESEITECTFHPAFPDEFQQSRLAQIFSGGTGDAFHPRTTIDFHDVPQTASQMDAALQTQSKGIYDIVRQAQERGQVASSEVKLTIFPTVQDLRRNHSEALPALTPREVRVP